VRRTFSGGPALPALGRALGVPIERWWDATVWQASPTRHCESPRNCMSHTLNSSMSHWRRRFGEEMMRCMEFLFVVSVASAVVVFSTGLARSCVGEWEDTIYLRRSDAELVVCRGKK